MSNEVDFSELQEQVSKCEKCQLSMSRINTVFGVGNPNRGILFVSEAPGATEDAKGEPFIGDAGQMLDELLASIGEKRENIFIANIIKCRPPANRDPEPYEVAQCTRWLRRQIIMMNPKLIVMLGRVSLDYFFPDEKISDLHGKAKKVGGVIYFFSYHPAYAIYQRERKVVLEEDFGKLAFIIKKLGI